LQDYRLRRHEDVKNCRTSVEMIAKYYALHMASSLDAAAINVRRTRKRKKGEAQDDENEE
jgi:hypothetical protein